MGKMDPCQADAWWKSRIEKEEATYVDKKTQKAPSKIVLNSLGSAQEVPTRAAETHLVGGGALVRKAKAVGLADISGANGERGSKAGSIASSKLRDLEAGSQVGSHVARSNVSYPRTPQFSQAGSKGSNAEIMTRLACLEKDLNTERQRREAAETEMKQLMTIAHNMGDA